MASETLSRRKETETKGPSWACPGATQPPWASATSPLQQGSFVAARKKSPLNPYHL